MRLTIKDVIRLQKKSGSKVRGRLFTGRPVPTQQWLLGFREETNRSLGVYAACLYSRIGLNLTTSAHKKVNHEMAPERFS